MRQLRFFLILLFGFCLCGLTALAHVSDTSLLRIHILPKALVLDLNVDLSTLQKIAPLDSNADGRVDRTELTQAAPGIEQYFRDNLRLFILDGPPELGKMSPPEWQGEATPDAEAQNAHVNFHFERPMPEGQRAFSLSVDIFNTLGNKHSLIVALIQGNNSEQTVLTADLPVLAYDPISAAGPAPQLSSLEMFRLGVEHILSGTDHLLFLLTLLVAVGSWRQMVFIVTAFTLAHSVTLLLAALRIVRLPEPFVESMIAASIVWVAAENLLRGEGGRRWMLSFVFGLIHGFGFAGNLEALDLPRQGFLRSVLLFNGGVEAGQLLVVLPLLPLIFWMRRFSWHLAVQRVISGSALVLALWWVWERSR
jgi:hydrogenase/urease accessory protein HupE